MSDLVPAPVSHAATAPSLFAPLTDPFGGPALTRLASFARQEPVRRMLPWFLGVAALGGAALAWSTIAPSPQRTLYGQLEDGERAHVVAALEKAAVPYQLDSQTGALTVAEEDYYRARMLVASDNALASPTSGSQMLDSLPIGASRSLEGERLREARARELMLTIEQIDGVEAVRVHLAEPERSVFVRDDVPKGGKPADLAQLKQLVGAAVGADAARGDQVEVVVRRFEPLPAETAPFYETPWFATLVRITGAVLAVLLVLLLGVRPLIKAFRPGGGVPSSGVGEAGALAPPMLDMPGTRPDPSALTRNVGAAQRLVAEQPDRAVAALRQMLADQPQARP